MKIIKVTVYLKTGEILNNLIPGEWIGKIVIKYTTKEDKEIWIPLDNIKYVEEE